MLIDLTVEDFLDKVACSDPVLDGGSIAALNGALAPSLSTMTAWSTIGKKGYKVSEEVMQHVQTITLRLLNEFMVSIDKDSATYNEAFACFKLPKTTDEEKATRSATIQKAAKQAALVPLEVTRKAPDMTSVITDVARLGNRNAITDACVAMMSARTAVLGALPNIRINLGSLKDGDFVLQLQTEADTIEQTACQREENLLDAINQDLRV